MKSDSSVRNICPTGVLSLVFLLGVVFLFISTEVSAHVVNVGGKDVGDMDDEGAKDVDPTVESDVQEFLSHVKEHYDSLIKSTGRSANQVLSVIARDFRTQEVYKTDEMYVIVVDAGGTVLSHSKYPELFGYKLDSTKVKDTPAEALQILINESAGGNTTECEDYKYDGKTRQTCGISITFGPARDAMKIIVGLDHENRKDDGKLHENNPFSKPDCSVFPALPVTAEDVYKNPTEELLKGYVKSSIGSYQQALRARISKLINDQKGAGTLDLSTPQGIAKFTSDSFAEISSSFACLSTSEVFKHKNIYLFVMTATSEGTVFINANDPNLNGLTLELEDKELEGEDKKIVTLFRKKLVEGEDNEEPQAGYSANGVTYRWDNPEVQDDENENYLEEKIVPGTSLKVSYIEVVNILSEAVKENPSLKAIPTLNLRHIFGSGIYPPPVTQSAKDDDDGCAIAGTGHSPQSALVNLLFMVSVLFSVVFLKRRV